MQHTQSKRTIAKVSPPDDTIKVRHANPLLPFMFPFFSLGDLSPVIDGWIAYLKKCKIQKASR
jgi:hypothetical protein